MKDSSSTTAASSLAAIGSALAAATCCIPLGTMWLAATIGGAGVFLEPLRPWLTALSVALIAFGFWQARRARQCSPGRRRLNFALLSVAAVFVGASIAFPSYLSFGSHEVPSGQPALVELSSADQLAARWNRSPGKAKVLVLLSPT